MQQLIQAQHFVNCRWTVFQWLYRLIYFLFANLLEIFTEFNISASESLHKINTKKYILYYNNTHNNNNQNKCCCRASMLLFTYTFFCKIDQKLNICANWKYFFYTLFNTIFYTHKNLSNTHKIKFLSKRIRFETMKNNTIKHNKNLLFFL